ncbi:tannase/feruloyl esterase family alpha/beta hydrolase [Elongatibacter sediminis]|uniref:Tannase/feruloyl esterase family alpha/beta hydrolase n=1 Tax=Elongatibacter sediminis TaxID=3119006 RepID=A0AAW9R5L7_9GAMM
MRAITSTPFLLLAWLGVAHVAPVMAEEISACEALAEQAPEATVIHSAETVAAGAFMPPGPQAAGPGAQYSELPEFCRVTGSIQPSADSDIRFELWLPAATWNGKFLQTGNGGAAGAIIYDSLANGLQRGYAVANTDTGHQGGMGDFTWAVGHPEKLVDYQHRAVHELTRVGKAVTESRYGRAPEKSYWLGCSTGGRQGLKEAQKYPADYDAIIAGAPANNLLALLTLTAHIQHEVVSSGLGTEQLKQLQEAAIAACDAHDGIVDRLIARPERCTFDPSSLQCARAEQEDCLTEPQVAAAQRLYAGLVDDAGNELFPGTGPGSEREWGAYAMPMFRIGTSYFQNVVYQDPDWDPASLDPAAAIARAEQLDAGAAKAMDPDLSEFVANGGKLILFHGTTDGMIPYRNTVNYYDSVIDHLGDETAQQHVRLYLVPGMNHCSGGEGPFNIDWLTALEQWSEDNVAPGAVTGSHPDEIPDYFGMDAPQPSQPYSRPVCPYPQVAKYSGSGSQTDAANFSCGSP